MNRARLVRFGLAFATLSASTHVYQLIIESRHLERAAELGILTSSSYALVQLLFILSLVVLVVGLLMRNLPGLITSILGLVGVLLGYGYWYSYSSRWLMGLKRDPFYAEHPEFVPSQLFGLVGAHWWDAVILALAIILLILMFITLVRFRHRKENLR